MLQVYIDIYGYNYTITQHIPSPWNKFLVFFGSLFFSSSRTPPTLPGLELAANFRNQCAIRWGAQEILGGLVALQIA